MDADITHVRLICGRVECLIDGFLLEMERVCDEDDNTDIDTDFCLG